MSGVGSPQLRIPTSKFQYSGSSFCIFLYLNSYMSQLETSLMQLFSKSLKVQREIVISKKYEKKILELDLGFKVLCFERYQCR